MPLQYHPPVTKQFDYRVRSLGILLECCRYLGIVFINDGGHDWATWSLLWADVLESESWTGLGNSG
jgi:hypothetical protein